MKTYLKSYEMVRGGYLTDGGTPFWLNVLEVSFFGLIKKEKRIAMSIPWDADFQATTDKWDILIKTKTPLK